jgi:hypothetical protein
MDFETGTSSTFSLSFWATMMFKTSLALRGTSSTLVAGPDGVGTGTAATCAGADDVGAASGTTSVSTAASSSSN